jgi:hypothetical protein
VGGNSNHKKTIFPTETSKKYSDITEEKDDEDKKHDSSKSTDDMLCERLLNFFDARVGENDFNDICSSSSHDGKEENIHWEKELFTHVYKRLVNVHGSPSWNRFTWHSIYNVGKESGSQSTMSQCSPSTCMVETTTTTTTTPHTDIEECADPSMGNVSSSGSSSSSSLMSLKKNPPYEYMQCPNKRQSVYSFVPLNHWEDYVSTPAWCLLGRYQGVCYVAIKSDRNPDHLDVYYAKKQQQQRQRKHRSQGFPWNHKSYRNRNAKQEGEEEEEEEDDGDCHEEVFDGTLCRAFVTPRNSMHIFVGYVDVFCGYRLSYDKTESAFVQNLALRQIHEQCAYLQASSSLYKESDFESSSQSSSFSKGTSPPSLQVLQWKTWGDCLFSLSNQYSSRSFAPKHILYTHAMLVWAKEDIMDGDVLHSHADEETDDQQHKPTEHSVFYSGEWIKSSFYYTWPMQLLSLIRDPLMVNKNNFRRQTDPSSSSFSTSSETSMDHQQAPSPWAVIRTRHLPEWETKTEVRRRLFSNVASLPSSYPPFMSKEDRETMKEKRDNYVFLSSKCIDTYGKQIAHEENSLTGTNISSFYPSISSSSVRLFLFTPPNMRSHPYVRMISICLWTKAIRQSPLWRAYVHCPSTQEDVENTTVYLEALQCWDRMLLLQGEL